MSYLLTSFSPVVVLVYQPSGPGSIPGKSCGESAIARGKTQMMLLPPTVVSWTTCIFLNRKRKHDLLNIKCQEKWYICRPIQNWSQWSAWTAIGRCRQIVVGCQWSKQCACGALEHCKRNVMASNNSVFLLHSSAWVTFLPVLGSGLVIL